MSENINQPESFAQLFEESLARQEMRQGEVITAEVVRVDYNFVVVNAGLKSEAYVPIEEFKDDRLNKSKTATVIRFCLATRPSVLPLG